MSVFAPAPTSNQFASLVQQRSDFWVKRVNAGNEATARAMGAAYQPVLIELEKQSKLLGLRLEERRLSGEPFSPSWLFREARYKELIRQTQTLVGQYGAFAAGVTTSSQAAAVQAAYLEATEMIRALDPALLGSASTGFAAIPKDNVARLMGQLTEGPAKNILAEFGTDAAAAMRTSLVRDMALGLSSREMVNNLMSVAAVPRTRATRIVRTETLRAANEGLRSAFIDSGVVTHWRWTATLSARTCAACLAMNGKVFPLTRPMARHVQCRCVLTPFLGDGTDPEYPNMDKWLKSQPKAVREQILGKAASEAYDAGFVELKNFLQIKESNVWGQSVQVRSLNNALKDSGQLQRYRAIQQAKLDAQTAAKKLSAEQKRQATAAKQIASGGLKDVAWRPSMSAAEADIWAQGSALPQTFLHATNEGAAKAILQEGFKVDPTNISWGRVWGNGAYMTDSRQTIDMYRYTSTQSVNPPLLHLRANVSKPWVFDMSDLDDVYDSMSLETMALQLPKDEGNRLLAIHRGSTEQRDILRAERDDLYDKSRAMRRDGLDATDEYQALQDEINRLDDALTVGQNKADTISIFAEEMGYDALVVQGVNGNLPNSFHAIGGDQVVVFNPKKITVIDVER